MNGATQRMFHSSVAAGGKRDLLIRVRVYRCNLAELIDTSDPSEHLRQFFDFGDTILYIGGQLLNSALIYNRQRSLRSLFYLSLLYTFEEWRIFSF